MKWIHIYTYSCRFLVDKNVSLQGKMYDHVTKELQPERNLPTLSSTKNVRESARPI